MKKIDIYIDNKTKLKYAYNSKKSDIAPGANICVDTFLGYKDLIDSIIKANICFSRTINRCFLKKNVKRLFYNYKGYLKISYGTLCNLILLGLYYYISGDDIIQPFYYGSIKGFENINTHTVTLISFFDRYLSHKENQMKNNNIQSFILKNAKSLTKNFDLNSLLNEVYINGNKVRYIKMEVDNDLFEFNSNTMICFSKEDVKYDGFVALKELKIAANDLNQKIYVHIREDTYDEISKNIFAIVKEYFGNEIFDKNFHPYTR